MAKPSGIGTVVQRIGSPGSNGAVCAACSFCPAASAAVSPTTPTDSSWKSGGCIRVLGDPPRNTTIPVGSRTVRSRSAVITITNWLRATSGSTVVPLATAPSELHSA